MSQILWHILLLIVLFYVLDQVRKPTRWIGRLFAWTMNTTHSSLRRCEKIGDSPPRRLHVLENRDLMHGALGQSPIFSHLLTDWGLKHVPIEKNFTILDVGCGGGRTIQKLAAIATEGTICGVDFAKGSIAASCGENAALIYAGRLKYGWRQFLNYRLPTTALISLLPLKRNITGPTR